MITDPARILEVGAGLVLLGAFTLTVTLAMVPTGLVSMVVRLRRRIEARRAGG